MTALSRPRTVLPHFDRGLGSRRRRMRPEGGSMTSHTVRFATAVLLAAGVLSGASASAQQPDAQAALVNDLNNLSSKFTGLARAMTGKYDWRPGQGVRSAGDVFNLIVAENNMLAGVLSGAGGKMDGGAITDPAALQEALRGSYDKVRQALTTLPAKELNAAVKV